MDKKLQYISVFAICLSIIAAAAIISYNPFQKQQDEDDYFKFPVGIPPALGSYQSVQVGEEVYNAIHISGSGSSSAQANQATVTLGVYTEKPYANEAVEENAAVMNSVLDALKALGITEEKMKTVTYSVNPIYDWELKRNTGYRVTNMVQVEIDNLNLVGTVIDEASEAGANNIQGISFGLSEDLTKQLQTDAYVNALNDARGKADLIAQTLDLEITGVLSVSESVYYPYTPYRGFEEASMDAPAPTPIIEGSLSVSVNVQVAFTFL